MALHRSRTLVVSRWFLLVVMVFSALTAIGQALPGSGQTRQLDTPMPTISEMSWPEGVELLAAQTFVLPEGDLQWRISIHQADDLRGQVFETGRGVVVAVNGTILLEVNGQDYIRLQQGAAYTLHEEDELTATSVGDDPVDVLVIELLPFAEDNTTSASNLVGPLSVEAGGHALVLLNLPSDSATTTEAREVISGALQPAVSIAYNDEGIPETLETGEEYGRWIVALYPPTPPSTPPPAVPEETTAPPATPASSTPTTAATPTATATATVTPTATATATATATVSPTPADTPTATATSTPSDTPTATATATATEAPTATNTPQPPTPTEEPEPTVEDPLV
jgi:hypothetical protein